MLCSMAVSLFSYDSNYDASDCPTYKWTIWPTIYSTFDYIWPRHLIKYAGRQSSWLSYYSHRFYSVPPHPPTAHRHQRYLIHIIMTTDWLISLLLRIRFWTICSILLVFIFCSLMIIKIVLFGWLVSRSVFMIC